MNKPFEYVVLATLLLVAGCGQVYSPTYISRVLMKQDANVDDYLWKRSRVIPRAHTPTPLPVADESERVRASFADANQRALDPWLDQHATTAFIVIQNGSIIYEKYLNGAAPDAIQATFSVSKSILSILLGSLMLDHVALSLDEPITSRIPALAARDARFKEITLGNLIDMRSGLKYDHGTPFPFVNADAPLVYYATDLRAVVQQKTAVATAPGPFHYNDYNPNLIALALEYELGTNPLSLVQARIFDPVGAEHDACWSTDNHGFAYWDSGLVAAPRDLARIGLMMLNGGLAPGGRIISGAWHARSTTYPDVALPPEINGRQWAYRNGWWQILRPTPPNDYAAIGRFGQMLYISPRNRIVIVRTGLDTHYPDDRDLTQAFYALADNLGQRHSVTSLATKSLK